MNSAFFDAVRESPFNGALTQSAVDGLNAIAAAWKLYGDGDKRKLAYILATAFHECDRFRTMEEYASGAAYEDRKDLGNTARGDGVRFKGRGFVQLTGRANYQKWAARLGENLIQRPELVCDRNIAARILVEGMLIGSFTGRYLRQFVNDQTCDFVEARRVVNGIDRAVMIAGYARPFLAALEAMPVVAVVPVPLPPVPPPDDNAGRLAAAVAALIAALIAGGYVTAKSLGF